MIHTYILNVLRVKALDPIFFLQKSLKFLSYGAMCYVLNSAYQGSILIIDNSLYDAQEKKYQHSIRVFYLKIFLSVDNLIHFR